MKDSRQYLTIVTVVLLAYGPMSRATFGFGDDYNLLPHNEALGYLHLMDGRFILALAQDYIHRPISHVSQFGYLRFIGSLGLCAIAMLFYQQTESLFPSRFQRVGLSVAIALLPCLQTYIGQAILWLSTFTGFLAMWACTLTLRATETTAKGVASFMRAYVPPLVVMVIASMMYQPLLSMYWTMAMVYLLDARFRSSKQYRWRMTKVLAAGVLYFIACLIVFKLSFLFHDNVPKSRTQFTHDPLYKLYWFMRVQVPLAFNFWHLMELTKRLTNLVLPLVCTLVIASGYLLSIRERERESSSATEIEKSESIASRWIIGWQALLLVGVFMLTHIHWLILAIVPQSYRIIAPLGVAALILVFWSVSQWVRLISDKESRARLQQAIVIVLVVGAFWLCQHYGEKYWIAPQSTGYRYMMMTIRDKARNSTNHVHVIQQTENDGLVAEVFVEAFGRPASEREWTIKRMTQSAIRDSRIPNEIEKISFGDSSVPVPDDDSVLVVDMRKLKLMRLHADRE